MGAVADVRAYLTTQTLIDGATGWPSIERLLHDGSQRLVVLTEDGGPPPEIAKDDGIGSAGVADAGVQVLVRGAAGEGAETFAKAKAILDALHSVTGETFGARRYMAVRSQTAEPIFAGYDERARPLCTVNLRLLYAL